MNDKEDLNELQRLKPEFVEHLQKLQLSFKNYFPDQRKYPEWIRQPFSFDTTTVDTNNQHIDDIIELQESKVQKLFFNSTNLETFWCQQMESYPRIAKVALDVHTSFVTTYLCERAFSTLVEVKTKKRNRLACENDLRIAVSETKPRISQLVARKEQQKAH